ncbi:MAG: Ig-like domain-containing protein [Nitrospirae bacterium]|nr:Ig-like domain-containing protein [Nitrospirota bacterium]
MRKLLFNITLSLLILHWAAEYVFALTIISPNNGQIVNQGDKVQAIVKPDAGEKWEKVQLDIYPMSYSIFTNDYREEILIPYSEIGLIDFSILAYDKTGREIELKMSLFVKLPPNVVLEGLSADRYKTLYKRLSDQSSPAIQGSETRQLHVYGTYSDKVERDLTSSASGTTYTSSNEKIVIVSPEGKITSQGLGTAKIIVRNGKYSAHVDIVVEPYKK